MASPAAGGPAASPSADGPVLTPTTAALLGQLALRPWSVYEMTQNVARTLHWFWPRAESLIYAEVKRLAAAGLATADVEPGRRGRTRTNYAITDAGRSALRSWLEQPVGGTTLHSEPALRVHLAPFGTKDDLVRALERAAADAQSLLAQATAIGAEFETGVHQFQDQVHVRAILFDFLARYGEMTALWASRWRAVVEEWEDVAPDATRLEAGRAAIAADLRDLERGVASTPSSGAPARSDP